MKLNAEKLKLKFILLSFFLSQFYLWSSGLPQFSHILIILCILFFLFKSMRISVNEISILGVFIVYVIFVNSIWFFWLGDWSFVVSTIYWIFNFFTLLMLINININNKNIFFNKIILLIPISYLISILIWAVGLGRYNFEPRYNGYFNDPNQMAFWVLTSCAIYIYIADSFYKKILIYLLAGFLISLTMSRSSTLGFLILTLGFILKSKGSIPRKIIYSFVSFLLLILLFFIFYSLGYFESVLSRFFEGVNNKDEQVSSRGFENLLNYPEYLIFGAGQGAYDLYSETGNEIHSTWLGIFFYYGIIGIVLFCGFIYSIFSKLKIADKIIFAGPLFYGFFTYNARTLIFWFLIAIFLLYSKHREQT